MRGPCEYEVGLAKPLKHTCQLGEVASSETCNDREIYPFLPVEVHTRDGALRKARYQNIFMISDEKMEHFWLIEIFLFGFDSDFTTVCKWYKSGEIVASWRELPQHQLYYV